jgi:2,3-dimethylmalate lyase
MSNARTGQIMERFGVEAAFVGTGITYGNYTGLPDTGLASSTECLMIGGWNARAVNFPVILDGDTGHGGPPAVKHFVRGAIREGLAGVRFDDQPIEQKRGTQSSGIAIADRDAAVRRYQAAIEAKNEIDPSFVIMAQCYARDADNGSMEELLDRLSLYETEGGVDWVQFESPHSVEEVKAARARVKGPLSVMQGKMDRHLTLEEHKEIGLDAAWYTGMPTQIQAIAATEFLADFQKRGLQALWDFRAAHPVEG